MKIVKQHFLNLTSLLFYFCKGGRFCFFGASFFMATSRILQTIAFFLPIKVLIMMESDYIPSYFNVIDNYVGYDQFLIFLVSAVPLLYISHFVMGVFHRKLLDKGLSSQPDIIHKLDGVNNFGLSKARKLYGHSVKCFSEVVLFFICSVILLVINLWLFMLVVVIIFLNLTVFVKMAFYASEDDRLTFFNLHRRQFIEYLASSNYLFIFAFLVSQMIFFSEGVYEAILALLLSRQLFQALQRFSFENLHLSRMWKSNMES